MLCFLLAKTSKTPQPHLQGSITHHANTCHVEMENPDFEQGTSDFVQTLCACAVVSHWVDSNKKTLSLISSSLLILVPWMQISKAVMSDVAVNAASLLAVLAAGIALHLVFLVFNVTAVNALSLGKSANASGKQGHRL